MSELQSLTGTINYDRVYPTIDPSLSIAGSAADAKATGDAIRNVATESTAYPGCYYRTVDGVVEWINPPMAYGMEYRTTERRAGKAVYRKLFAYHNSGTIGSAGTLTNILIPHGISDFYSLARCSVKLEDYCLPIAGNNTWTGITKVDSENVNLRLVNEYWGERDWYIDLAYTKNT